MDENGNPQADLTEVTVLATNKGSNIPPHKPLSEVVEAVAQHQAAGFSPSTNNNIPQSGEKSNPDLEFSRKRLHQQIKNRAEREGGQVLVTESNAQGSSGLHDLSSGNINNIPQSGEKSNPDLEFSRKRLHQQINPIVRDGKVRDEYADLLANK